MTKGHNQDKNKQTNPTATKKDEDQMGKADQNKSPNQGRNENKDQSGGTKGKNSIK